jgi:hypothetical protein
VTPSAKSRPARLGVLVIAVAADVLLVCRVVTGESGEFYDTADHYDSFERIVT